MIGRTVSHYRILSPLGSGGMGVVYLAEDERLGRQVALKFLPEDWSQHRKALERFRVEARAASSLSHPAICAVYDIGEDGKTPFIVMEALKGETLRDRITRGPLRVADVLDIGIQLADALGAAHEQGIVHRDIKPANIFLGDKNRVKVLDFGLAKLTGTPSTLSSAADTMSPLLIDRTVEQMTQPGTALGTVSYMSPEQARGENIDSRTDLFSMGAVLYEMVTGSQAFGGSTTAVVYDAILNRAPRPIAQLNPLIPQRLETLIATALEKDRELRQQHATDLEAELKRIRRDLDSASLASSQPVLAVAAAASSPSVAGTLPPVASTTQRSWERAALIVAVVAAVFAAVWFWSGRQTTVVPAQSALTSVAAPVAPLSPPPGIVAPPPAPRPEAEAPRAAPREVARQDVPVPRSTPKTAPSPTPQVGREAAPATPPAAPSPVSTAPAAALPPPPAAPEPQPTPAATAPAAPVVASTPAPVATPPRAAAPEPAAAPQPQPAAQTAPVETDEAAIRRVIRTYEQAIETKDVALYRSVRPRLSAAADAVLRNSFRQSGSQEVDIRVDSLRIDGRTATARVTRTDTLVTSGRRQTNNTAQVLRFEKADAGWIITE